MHKLWTEVVEVGGDNAVWDGFHKFNKAGNDFAMLQKISDVFKQQEYMSAMGRKELRIGFAEYLGKGRHPPPGNMRPPESWLHQWSDK